MRNGAASPGLPASPRSSRLPGVLGRAAARLRSRLVLRIYLAGLVQFFFVAVGIVVAAQEARRSDPSLETLRIVAESVAASPDDTRAVAVSVANAEKLLHTSLALYDEGHRLLAGTTRSGLRPPPTPPRADGPPPPADRPLLDASGPPGPPPLWARLDLLHEGPPAVPVVLRDGRVWRLVVTSPRPLSSLLRGVGTTALLVLLVVGVSAWLTARSLAKPLARLVAVTHAFGSGDLEVRADLGRNDELGEVAAAFDQMADRVGAALRAEKELLANVSHELRTPLQRIHIAIDLAAEGDAATARESLGEIAEDLAELERIVEDVLSAARLSLRDGRGGASALPPIRVASIDFAALLQKSAGRFRSLYPTRRLDVELRGTLPPLEIDAALVHRAVDNLLDNAHKYTDDANEPVALAAWSDSGQMVVVVRDRGIGIDTPDQKRLFEPFFRADRSRNRGSGGLGLGLALAKRIVEAHGGTLGVESALGSGTTARIELPVGGAP